MSVGSHDNILRYEATCAPHEHYRVHAPLSFPGPVLPERRCGSKQDECETAEERSRVHARSSRAGTSLRTFAKRSG
jgi:hypothetical protein